MNDQTEIDQLYLDVSRIRSELEAARARLVGLKRRRVLARWTRGAAGTVAVAGVALASWAAFAQKGGAKPPILTVKAPFQVVDSKGRPIFSVRDHGTKHSRGAHVHASNGMSVAQMVSEGKGGVVRVLGENNQNEKVVFNHSAVTVWDSTGIAVNATRNIDHGGVVQVYAKGGGTFPVAELTTFGGGKGQVAVYNRSASAIARLHESAKIAGAGRVTVATPDGAGAFYASETGLPGETAACVARRGKMTECLGIDLPLSIHISPQ